MTAVRDYEPGGPTPSPVDRPPEQRGETDVKPAALAHIAERAAHEVPGVHGVEDNRMLVGSDGRRRIDASADMLSGRRVKLDMTVGIDYPGAVRATLDALRAHVIERVEALSGYDVARLDVDVAELRRVKPRRRVQ
jgi:uncharacterized alkaline shock family protein YloU